jgi:predicted pyridoxine 5'-phosphate oxidase superfamily flavin-nucleotide-binding protein
MTTREVFHSGEIAVQVRAGERAIAKRRESIVLDRLNAAASAFVARQGVVAVAAAAPDGSVWASLWCGAPGFLRGNATGDAVEIRRDLDVDSADPVRPIVRPSNPLGVLVIDLEARQRLRINGIVGRGDDASFELRVSEAFGNCPKYIQQRLRKDDAALATDTIGVEQGCILDEDRRRFIARTDTFFVASVHPERGIDVSHRGGPPGFARVMNDRTLRIPDYAGNSMFQTLGNFDVDTRAGVAFVDFERRRVLSAAGHATSDFGNEDPAHPTGGTGRYWSFSIERWVEFSLPRTMTWTLVEQSPFNPR